MNSRVFFYRKLHYFLSTVLSDLASMMFELAQAFKKHEVTEPPCQRYVACEASQESRLDQNGAFARLVNRIMR